MDASVEVMIFMGLILKIPVALACWIIYWAWKSVPDPAEAPEDEGEPRYGRFRREPKRPKDPRRGPHAPDALPIPCPEDEGALRVRRSPVGRPLTAANRERR